jgi:NADH-quinone oxidoreductase subunit M
MPGFSGFAAELQILIGAWATFPTYAVLAGLGILVGVAYTLRALAKSFFSDAAPKSEEPLPALPPISIPERIGAVALIAITLVIGLYPKLLLDLIGPCFDSPLFEGLRKAGLL